MHHGGKGVALGVVAGGKRQQPAGSLDGFKEGAPPFARNTIPYTREGRPTPSPAPCPRLGAGFLLAWHGMAWGCHGERRGARPEGTNWLWHDYMHSHKMVVAICIK